MNSTSTKKYSINGGFMRIKFTQSVSRLLLAGFAMLAVLPTAGAQQQWPSQTIKMIVPFTPGTGADVLARVIGQKLSESLKQPVVVENRVGASGSIGTAGVAKSAPDGHTLLMTANTIVTNPHIQKNIPYDPLNDLTPISKLAVSSLAFAVNPSFPARTLPELIKLVKANPGKYTYASPGPGTPQHLAMELFKYTSGTDILHVPYKGSAGAVTDLLGGQVNMMIFPMHFALGYSATGKIRLLGVADSTRVSSAPSVPTFEEQGVKNSNVDAWYGFFAPAGTPEAIVTRLNGEVKRILAMPDVVDTLKKQGLTPTPSSPAEMNVVMKTDYARWADLVKKANIMAE
jgi:tripartite-type tricarboxylate transporter receptor subunit TctC